MQQTGSSFEEALAVTRAGNLFTTHTAVTAGFDRFMPSLIEQYLAPYAEQKLKISLHDLLKLGRRDPNDGSENFNMAYLAVRGSGAVSGVSQLHGKVSRRIFAPLFPNWPIEEVPVTYVTNGVHMPTWDSAQSDDLWTEACGKDRWLGTMETLEQDIRRVSDDRLWKFRAAASKSLVEYARKRLSAQLTASGAAPREIDGAKQIFDPNALTLGFARRFATYKRPNLLLHDPERLLHLLTNKEHPVQLIIAGKAHPADEAGQALIREWIRFIARPDARPHVIFLSDYDMRLTEHLVQGVDVWINTPRRPWEACGTSGMKVLVNGGINLSELDGWWAEAYTPEIGWALGDGKEHGDDPAWDAVEADTLYELLERHVVPEFYTREDSGIPVAWVNRMRESMAQLTPRFSANRAVREYTERHYLPAALAFGARTTDKGEFGKQMIDWQRDLDRKWSAVHFGIMKVETVDGKHVFEIQVYLDNLDPTIVKVELYAEGILGGGPVRQEMEIIVRPADGVAGAHIYAARVLAIRPKEDFTARVTPHFEGVSVPLEESRIVWQR
jgi:starch phosphorylase